MAFVKDGIFDIFKRDVETNFNGLEKRVDELEALLKKSTGGVTVDAVVPEPTPEPEPVQEEPVEEEHVLTNTVNLYLKKKRKRHLALVRARKRNNPSWVRGYEIHNKRTNTYTQSGCNRCQWYDAL